MRKETAILFICLLIFVIILHRCEGEDYIWKISSEEFQIVNITSSTPANSDLNVVLNATIIFNFSQSINPNTLHSNDLVISAGSNIIQSNQYSMIWQNNNKTLMFKTIARSEPWPLNKDSIYNLRLVSNNIRSDKGNPMKGDYSIAFTTSNFADTLKPEILNHQAIQNGIPVSPTGIIYPFNGIKYTFSEKMNKTDVQNAFQFKVNNFVQTPSGVQWNSSGDEVTFYFSNLPSGFAEASISVGAQDMAGNGIVSNLTDSFTVGGGNFVDYIVSQITVPGSGVPGGDIVSQFTIMNIGSLDGTKNISYTVYLSNNMILDDGDIQLTPENSTTGSINHGDSREITVSGKWPGTGVYYLLVRISSLDDQNNQNNTKISAVVPVGLPDYTIVNAVSPSEGSALSSFTGSFQIKNIGSEAGKESVYYSIYLATTPNGTDTLLTPVPSSPLLGGLGSGVTSSVISYTGNWSSVPNTYYINIVISSSDDSNLLNNKIVSIAVVTGTFDYKISNIYMSPTPYVVGNGISGSFVVENQGQSTGLQRGWSVYASDGVNTLGTLIASGTTVNISPNNYQAISFNGTWQPGTNGTSRYLWVQLSGNDSNSSNDKGLSGPFVIYSQISISPSSVNLYMNETQTFSGAGGSGSYNYSIFSGGGSMSGSTYRAPVTGPGTAVVRVTDDITGQSANSTVTINMPELNSDMGGNYVTADGVFLDIQNISANSITIYRFASMIYDGSGPFRIYYRITPYKTTDDGHWIYLGEGYSLSYNGLYTINFDTYITIPVGQTYGFYITTINSSMLSTSDSTSTVSNSDISLYSNHAYWRNGNYQGDFGGSIYHKYSFRGKVYYYR